MMMPWQNNPIWKKDKLGTSDFTIGSKGCFISCLGVLKGWTPRQVNEAMIAGGGYAQGCLVISEKVTKILGIPYHGKIKAGDQPWPTKVCIVDLDAVPKTSAHDQHFCIWLGFKLNGEWQIKDPWNGKNENLSKYDNKVVSFRMFEELKQEERTLKQMIVEDEHDLRLRQKAILVEFQQVYNLLPDSYAKESLDKAIKDAVGAEVEYDALRADIISKL